MLSVSSPSEAGVVALYVVHGEPLHQRMAVVREAPAGQPSGPAGRAASGRRRERCRSMKTEQQQRIGRLGETLVHAAAQNHRSASATSGDSTPAWRSPRRAWRQIFHRTAATRTFTSGDAARRSSRPHTSHLANHVVVKKPRVMVHPFICSSTEGRPWLRPPSTMNTPQTAYGESAAASFHPSVHRRSVLGQPQLSFQFFHRSLDVAHLT